MHTTILLSTVDFDVGKIGMPVFFRPILCGSNIDVNVRREKIGFDFFIVKFFQFSKGSTSGASCSSSTFLSTCIWYSRTLLYPRSTPLMTRMCSMTYVSTLWQEICVWHLCVRKPLSISLHDGSKNFDFDAAHMTLLHIGNSDKNSIR